ncbi:hypothetical protein KUTeg_007290 [Tegillarca granosa]|uniref:Ubiquitin carboxyl-terminal hydrolase n=1 Tax=Tegillarca granosa TaxID=220873 RepID=A0ABQ9FCT6_TEGGR|nr:hypothetical protein KUTeg_007290 [Tegillarca granosa]
MLTQRSLLRKMVTGENTQVVPIEVILEKFEEKSLAEICAYGVKRHDFTINERDEVLPQKSESIVEQTESEAETVASTSSAYFSTASTSTGDTYSSYSTYPENSYSYASAVIKSDTGYVGLVNQAMTCYLNSLLQTLYMTPEFRNALYRWSPDGIEDKSKSIPYQLQTLFLQLQTSKKRAAETTDLTRSFGWDSSEGKELCRVMFDALELKWKNTDQSHLINHLYQGKMKDYVKCLECGYESARVDAYLDIPLVIRPFGSNVTYGSVDEALDAFVQPEILNDSNQYFCEKCNKKCDAHKVCIMTFSEVLNLNHLVDRDSIPGMTDNATLNGEKSSQSVTEDSGEDEGIDEGIEIENGISGTSSGSDSSSLSSEAAANDKNAKELEYKGPYVYELFSIMIHSGSAAGGHYYAYIKSFKDGQWYCFNDQHVSKITYEDITKTYGGNSTARGYYSATYSSSTNAYMLMYRQIDKKKNADFIQPDNFPEHLKKHLQQIQEREEAEKRQRELDKSTCKIKVFCYHPVQRKRIEQKLEVHKDKTLKEATEMVHKLFDLEKIVTLDCIRLVKYDEYQDSLERSFEGEEETPMGKLLGGVKQTYNFDLLLETKRPDQHFQEYKPGGT